MKNHVGIPSCVFDDDGNKTQDCNWCGCSNSSQSGNHSPYNGKCATCGAPC